VKPKGVTVRQIRKAVRSAISSRRKAVLEKTAAALRHARAMDAQVPNPELFRTGTFGCHEALHAISILMDAVDRNICDHPAIMLDKRWRRMAHEAFDKLYDLYEEVGKVHLGG